MEAGNFMDSPDVVQLLVEIRDLHCEQFAEYCRVTQESLELSRLAISRQEQAMRLYRRQIAAWACTVVALAGFVAWFAASFR